MTRRAISRLYLGVLLFLTFLSACFLASNYSVAVDDETRNNDEVSCTLTYIEGTSRSISMQNGSYLTGIGNSTMKTICNDNSGYAIYTVGYSNNELGNNNMVATIDGTPNPTYDISSSNADSGATSAWAMKANTITGTYAPTIDNEFGQYRAVPNEYQRLAYLTDTTDDTVGSSISLSYAIYASGTQPAGTYTGKVKYTLVHPYNETPCVEGRICYHKNANNVVGNMGRQSATGTTATLWATNYSHEGYGFAGWNTKEDGTGTSYGPNETITLPSDMSEGLNLYAIWIKSVGNLQDWGGCYEMNIGDVTALTDQRDNDTYAIAKLADGKCWMIENLRLDNTNPDNATGALAQGYGISTTYGNFSGLASPEAPWIGDSTTANSLYSIDGSDGTINIGADNNPSRRFPRYNNQNTASRDSYPTTNQNIYSYGNYYTWAAAIADLNPNGTNNQTTTGTSLCPTGWHLPSGGAAYASDSATGVNITGDTDTYRDFYNLSYKIMDEIRTAYEDTAGSDGAYYSDNTTNLAGDTATKAFRKYPNNFVLSGYVYNGSISNRNSYGLYWSSTARNTDYAYRLYMSNSVVYPSTAGGNKFYGRSVRCVTNPTQRYEVTVNFDSGVESVTLRSDDFGTKTITTSGTVVSLVKDAEYTISGTYATDYGFKSWATTSNGTLGATDSAETTYTVSGTATLTLNSKRICSQGYICYDKNNRDANAPGGDMGNQAVSVTSATLWASNYGREGYGFAGWNTKADGTGTSYGPNETIEFDPTDEDGLMLYAMWVEPRGTLQRFSCAKNMPVGTVIGLLDERDDQIYAVAKLSDGKCWMIENMRINNAATVGANNKALSQGYGGIFDGLAAPELDTFADVTTNNSMYEARNIAGNNVSSRIPRYRNDNISNVVTKMTNEGQRVYSYGNYYNYPAAIANTSDFTTSGEITTTSICPAGWRIPSGGSKGYKDDSDYWALAVDALNEGITPTSSGGNIYDGDVVATNLSNTIRRYPNNFLNSGYAENGSSMNGKGGRGDYWSATNGDNDEAFRFSFRFNGVNPGTSPLHKYKGLAVRCVTGTVTKQTVTVNFDSGVSSVSLQSDRFGKYTVTTSGSTVKLADGVDYAISATYNTGKGFDGWTTAANGALGSASRKSTTYVVSGTTTLSLASRDACTTGYICYRRNDTATGLLSGTMGEQEITSNDMVLLASNYSNSEYGFAGWNTKADGSGVSYGPNETVHFEEDEDEMMLYAMWVRSVGYLQNWYCPSEDKMPIGAVTALTDYRDNQVYAVAKLADGKCWMIENMRLESENTVGNSINNSNITNQSLAQGYASSSEYGNFIGLANAEQSNFNTNGNSNSIYGTDIGSIIDIGHIDASAYRVPRYNNTNTLARASEPTDNTENIYSYGNYYTWHAAIADTAYYGVDNKNLDETSICPAGWELPTGGSAYIAGSTNGVNVTGDESTYRDYYNLGYHLIGVTAYENNSNNGHSYYSASTGEIFRKYPNNFLYSGVYYDSSAQDRGTSAYYWTATSSGNDVDAYQLSISQDVRPGTDNVVTYKGAAIRCINDNTPKNINGLEYMQDFANLSAQELEVVKSNMIEDEQYLIKDSRDNKEYFISKLADGNIWMTQDLDHDIVTTPDYYTYENTDIGHGEIKDTNATWTASTATYETGDTTWTNGGDGNNIPQSYDPGNVIWDGVPDESWYTTLDNMVQGFKPHYRIGNYYDWTAAIAMNDSSSYTSGEIDQSICPAGWTLPRAGDDDETPGTFRYLIKQYGYDSSTLHMDDPHPWEAPLYYAYGGYWKGFSDVVASFAYYWSSSVDGESSAYNMSADPDATAIAPNAAYSRSDGLNVRCITRSPKWSINDLEHMQDFATLSSDAKADVLNSMAEGEQYQLTDSRDDKVYYISKLADGNVWMTQNLDFDIVNGGADINSTNTDVPANWTSAGHLNNTYATDYYSWERLGRYSESYDAGDLCWDGSIGFNDDAEWYQYAVPCTDRHYHVGNYYNWTAAVALEDSSMYFAQEESTGNDNVDVNQSICPAGWMLPKDGISSGSGSYEYLVSQQHLTDGASGNVHQAPTYFIYGGRYYGSIPDYFGGEGLYITSVFLPDYYNSTGNMTFNESGEEPIQFNVVHGNDDGYTIRCLVRK